MHENQKNYHGQFFFSWCMFKSHVSSVSDNFGCFNLVLNSWMGWLGTKCCSVIAYGGSSGSVSQLPGTRWLSILRCKSTSISSSSVKVRWNKKYHQRWRQHRPINCLDFLDCCHCCHCCHCLHCSHCFQFLHCIDYLDCLHTDDTAFTAFIA